jgi:RNA polymerase sigma factor for flagellar operon FliA
MRGQQLSPEALQETWEQYWRERSDEARRRLLLHYLWLVRYAVQGLDLPDHSVLSEEDLLHTGVLGLNEAIERFDPTRGTKFETYALPRIRGAMLDELRKLDWMTRSARQKLHTYHRAAELLRQQKGDEVSSEEVRHFLGLSEQEYRSYLQVLSEAYATLPSEPFGEEEEEAHPDPLETVPDPHALDPSEEVHRRQLLEFIQEYLAKLPERKRLVMVLYYYEGLTFREIGQLLNVTESRVCQIHAQVLEEIRTQLRIHHHA